MLIWWEIKKILSNRLFQILFICVLAVNAAVCFMQSGINDGIYTLAEEAGIKKAKEKIYAEYEKNPDEIIEKYNSNQEIQQKNNQMMLRNFHFGEPYTPLEINNEYIDLPQYKDKNLYENLFGMLVYANSFHDKIENVIKTAYLNLYEIKKAGSYEDSYSYRYQTNVILNYEPVRDNVTLQMENIRGWDKFFRYNVSNILLFFLVSAVFSYYFIYEKNTGMSALLNVSKKGRAQTGAAKLISAVIISAAAVISVSTVSLLAVWARCGLSSPSQYIHIFEDFLYCPFTFKIWQYLLVFIALKIAVFAAVAVVSMLISKCVPNELYAYGISAVFFGCNFMLNMAGNNSSLELFARFSLLRICDVNAVMRKYTGIDLFGHCIGYFQTAFFCLAVVIVIFAILTLIFKPFSSGIKISGLFRKLPKIDFSSVKYNNNKARPCVSILTYEFKKTALNRQAILIFVILMILKIASSSQYYSPLMSSERKIYGNYIQKIQGEYTAEKELYLEEENKRINTAESKFNEMHGKYLDGDITSEELRPYIDEFNYASINKNAFNEILLYKNYITVKINDGYEAHFVDEYEFIKLFRLPIDIFLIACILLIFTRVFTDEYRNGFHMIMRQTKNGRNKSWRAKTAVILICAVGLFAVFTLTDIIFFLKNFDGKCFGSPLMSIQYFGGSELKMNILQYAVLHETIRFIGTMLLSIFIMSASCLLKNIISVITAVFGVILVPYLLTFGGFISEKVICFMPAGMLVPEILFANGINIIAVVLPLYLTISLFIYFFSKSYWNGKEKYKSIKL